MCVLFAYTCLHVRFVFSRTPLDCHAFMCVTWHIHVCDMTYSYVCHDTFCCVTWLIRTCDVTHSYVWHDYLLEPLAGFRLIVCFILIWTCTRAHMNGSYHTCTNMNGSCHAYTTNESCHTHDVWHYHFFERLASCRLIVCLRLMSICTRTHMNGSYAWCVTRCVCCSVLQCVPPSSLYPFGSCVTWCVTWFVCCSVLQCLAVCVAVCATEFVISLWLVCDMMCDMMCVLQCVAVCVAVCLTEFVISLWLLCDMMCDMATSSSPWQALDSAYTMASRTPQI